jgi:hypothetical protein
MWFIAFQRGNKFFAYIYAAFAIFCAAYIFFQPDGFGTLFIAFLFWGVLAWYCWSDPRKNNTKLDKIGNTFFAEKSSDKNILKGVLVGIGVIVAMIAALFLLAVIISMFTPA